MSDTENRGTPADPQSVPMAEEYGTHDAVTPNPDNREGTEKAFDAENSAPPPGPDREVSAEEEQGVSATDMTAASPLGVGESINTRGEDVGQRDRDEAGRDDEDTESASGRRAGTSTARDSTGVDPQGSSSGGPDLQSGDQGG